MKQLENKSSEASNKGSDTNSDKESNNYEESDDECTVKKDRSLDSMFVEQIQNLIANAVNWEEGCIRPTCIQSLI